MANIITSHLNLVRSHLPTPKRAVLGTLAIAASAYLGGIPTAIATIAAFGSYRLAMQGCGSQGKLRLKMVQEKLKTELFKRLPQPLKEEILAETATSGVSNGEIALLQGNSNKWDDIELIRKTAIRACLEGKISEKELGYFMLCGMAHEMRKTLPGISFLSSSDQSQASIESMTDLLCQNSGIPAELLGNTSSKEDAFLVVAMNKPLDSYKPFHYTAQLSRDLYPFSMTNQKTGQTRIYVFSPHIYERLLAHFYPENPEKPLFALGTRKVETLSDNTRRILSMTGGTTTPTPNIEANEALSLPFYLHDCYHLHIDSAIGPDRVFWNAFGKHLLQYSKNAPNANIKEAFGALAEFCLDKEFQYYKQLAKNVAFLIPLIGMHSNVAGNHQTDDQKEPFKLITDESFAEEIQKEFLTQFKLFWHTHGLSLRSDLTKEKLLASVPHLNQILNNQGDRVPAELEQCLKSL